MTDDVNRPLPPEQQAIRDKCFHPSGTFVEFPIEDIETSIPARFEKIVRLYPDRLAVKMGDRGLTYQALNAAANGIAHGILQKRGPDSEAIVLLFGHDIDLIVALLGTLKAGKFYVAIDPGFPAAQIRWTLEDCQSKLIITDRSNIQLARQFVCDGSSLLNRDDLDPVAADLETVYATPGDPACIMYTSGSTGTPKGIVKPHRHVLATARLNTLAMGIRLEDRLTLLHSPVFAASEAMLNASLLNGVGLFPFSVQRGGIDGLGRFLSEENITVLHATPSVFRQLADLMRSQQAALAVRHVRITGAAITAADFDLYKTATSAQTRFEVGMGSTETGQLCSATVDRAFCFPAVGSPIGYAYAGKHVILVDESDREVGAGEIGEIVVKSRYLASGYWRNDELTAAQFAGVDGSDERTYRTSDLARRLPDGFLVHMGRKDSITKIRGYRVSLDEVEAALLDCPSVQQAAVAAWDDGNGDKSLTAYIVSKSPVTSTVSEIRRFLRTRLTDYMIPTHITFCDKLALVGGKIDRHALPRPEPKRPELDVPYESATTGIEKELAGIWQEVLGIQPIGVHDSFFDLGGHSLTATRIVSRVFGRFKLQMPLRSLFEAPTIFKMAAIVAEYQGQQIEKAEDLERFLADIEALSEEEARQQLVKGR